MSQGSAILPASRALAAKFAAAVCTRRVAQSMAWYSACALLSLALLGWLMAPWRGEMRLPWFYANGDGTTVQTGFKCIIEHGSYRQNPSLGAPFVQDVGDLPDGDRVHFTVAKMLSWFTGDWAVLYNVYLALMFPLIALTAMFACRRLGVSRELSAGCGVLYAFLPYHVFRMPWHSILASYWCIPLTVLVAVRLALGHRLTRSQETPLWKRLSAEGVFAVAVSALTGGCGIYYAVFGGMFFFIGGLYGAVQGRCLRPLWRAAALLVVLAVVMACLIVPSRLHSRNDTIVAPAFVRSAMETEVYGLRISQLVLPTVGHRLPFLARVRSVFDRSALVQPPNENGWVSLGLVGSIGFVALFACLMFPALRTETSPLGPLAAMNIFAITLATIGGFASLFSFFITPLLHAYNRVSIYVAFFCLLALALILNELRSRCLSRGYKPVAIVGGTLFCVLAGVWDQVGHGPPGLSPLETTVSFQRDANFVHRIEAAVPKGSMIFQLPHSRFPDGSWINRIVPYDHLRAYLHSKTLRWSYGITTGSYGALWDYEMTAKPLPELVEALATAGFAGIYVDRYGYKDPAKEATDTLTALLGPPLDSQDARLAYFSLSPALEKLRSAYSAGQLQERREAVLNILLVQWRGEFSALEPGWRYGGHDGLLALEYGTGSPRTLTLDMDLVSATGAESDLVIEGPEFRDIISLSVVPQHWSKKVSVPPRGCTLRFMCNGPAIPSLTDPRIMVFKLQALRIGGVDPAAVFPLN